MATHTFRVEQMQCGACESAVREALMRLDGVTEVYPDSASDRVSVSYDAARTEPAAIARSLATAGYPVRD